MRYVCLLVLILLVLTFPATAGAQDGAAIYKERCASCHDAADSRAPKMEALKAMTGEAIYASLAMGGMKTQAQGLSPQQMFALAGLHRADRQRDNGDAGNRNAPAKETRHFAPRRTALPGMGGARASPTLAFKAPQTRA